MDHTINPEKNVLPEKSFTFDIEKSVYSKGLKNYKEIMSNL